jgi:Protein of unknown function (DUF4058)
MQAVLRPDLLRVADLFPGVVPMPSPFPGMDPYLEGSQWTSVHMELCAEIARQLAPKLRPKYVARMTRRFVLETLEEVAVTTQDRYPDVAVRRTDSGVEPPGGYGIATAPLLLETVMPEAVPHVTVEIRDTQNRQLVTAIEVLSPTNKRGDGYAEYVARRQRILLSTAHLLEIDLLRVGRRIPMRKPLPSAFYFLFLSRFPRRPVTETWPIMLDQPLPTVPVPLLADDPDVMLDLQSALSSIYDVFGYDLLIDYTKPPEIPLPEELRPWAEALIRKTAGF